MNDTLTHYGVLGMKWGVRRYQRKDGSLTPAGKKRYDNSQNSSIFENDKVDEFRLKTKNGLKYGFATRANVGENKNVGVNMIIDDSDKNSKSAKAKMQKAQKFINAYDDNEARNAITEKSANIDRNSMRLFSLDIEPDNDRAYATYTTTKGLPSTVEFEMSTNKILNKKTLSHGVEADDELWHWGIKGMRWGVRRFQRKDGSLTPEGKKRYDDDSDSRDSIEEKKARVLNTHSAETLYRNKDLFDDKELLNAYLRLNTERNIKSLIPEKVSKGQKFIDSYTKSSKNIKSVMDSSMDLYKSYEKGVELLNKLSANAVKKK